MADRIKGIVIDIGGDTTGLDKALSSTNSIIKTTQNELRDVERLLKLDPTNTELLAQKQKLLGDAVENTRTKLDALRDAEKKLKKEMESGKDVSKQYAALQREIVATEQALDKLEKQTKTSKTALQKLGDTAKTVADKAGTIKDVFAPATVAIGGLATAAIATVPATEELRTDLSKLDNAAREAGIGLDAARESWKNFVVATDETDSSVEAMANLLQIGFAETDLQKAMEGITGAYLRFPDTLKIESLADSLQETLATGTATGQFGELLDRLGIGAENFTNKMALLTSETDKQNFALQTLADAGLMETYQGWLQNNEELVRSKEATIELQEATSELASMIAPAITRVVEAGTKLLEWFNNLDPASQGAIISILGMIAVISPLAGLIGGASTLIATLTGTVLPALSAGITAVASGPMVLIVTAIAALIAIVMLCGDTIIETLTNAQEFLDNVFATDWTEKFGLFGNILNAFMATAKSVTDGVITFLKGVITFLKGVFTLDWQMAWQGLVDMFKGIVETMLGIVKSVANGIIGVLNTIIDGVNAVINALNTIQVDIPDWVPVFGGNSFGINIPNVGKIPYLAKGGVVTSGSAIVGEAGPELLTVSGGRAIVTPLTDGGRGGNTITQYNYFTGYEPRDGAEVVRDLDRQLGWEY